eukprot:scaffold151508_cov29-Tisochrysis_lutea.AAC.6
MAFAPSPEEISDESTLCGRARTVDGTCAISCLRLVGTAAASSPLSSLLSLVFPSRARASAPFKPMVPASFEDNSRLPRPSHPHLMQIACRDASLLASWVFRSSACADSATGSAARSASSCSHKSWNFRLSSSCCSPRTRDVSSASRDSWLCCAALALSA